MERLLQLRRSAAVFIGIAILVAGTVFGIGLTSWAGSTGLGSSHVVPLYVSRDGAAGNATPSGMGFAPILKPALTAVVSITSSRLIKVPQNPLFNDPFLQQFLGGQFPRGPQLQRERGLGSGVIVSPDGYILTNNSCRG